MKDIFTLKKIIKMVIKTVAIIIKAISRGMERISLISEPCR
ncbi:MAG: hypothetical protein QXP55_01960 [Nitrososphaerales archaeon]